MGFKDGNEDCDRFRRACFDGNVKASPSLLLRSALADAVCLRDPANNIKLTKACSLGRIDAASASVLAVAEGARIAGRTVKKGEGGGMGVRRAKFASYSRAILRSKRWPALRLAAKRRDGWKCVSCGSRGRLEVDHMKPVREAPELAFELSNLQCLCAARHSRKTRIEVGLAPLERLRRAWRDLLKGTTDVGKGENLAPAE